MDIRREVLEQCIREADEMGLPSRQQLWFEAARLYGERADQVRPGLVRRRAEEWGLELKTSLGRRGGRRDVSAKPRLKEFRESPRTLRAAGLLRRSVPAKYRPLVDEVARGSKAAGIKLQCLGCCGWQMCEVRKCTSCDCPLWLLRPYQEARSDSPEGQEHEVAGAAEGDRLLDGRAA